MLLLNNARSGDFVFRYGREDQYLIRRADEAM